MKTLIYQCYDGTLLPGGIAGVENMKRYAERIGSEYLFEANTKFGVKNGAGSIGKQSYFYDCLKPIYDTKFHKYDKVLYVDIDVFAVEGLNQSIFDCFDAEVGNCTEPLQPEFRIKSQTAICHNNDEKWAAVVEKHWNIIIPRTPSGLVKIYNAGLEIWSQQGLIKAKENFVQFEEYIRTIRAAGLPAFYTLDQNYFHTMMQVAHMDHVEMSNDWNCLVHHYMDNDKKLLSDPRNKDTKFVQIQLRSADHWDADTQWRITNSPVSEWNIK